MQTVFVACPQCQSKHFHDLACPELVAQVGIAFAVLTVGFGALILNWVFGGSQPRHLVLALVIWLACGTSWELLRRRKRSGTAGR